MNFPQREIIVFQLHGKPKSNKNKVSRISLVSNFFCSKLFDSIGPWEKSHI